MSKVIIPISVELGDSLNKIDKVTKKFKETADAAGKPIKANIETAISDAPLKSIRTQLREANIELQNAVANFGKISPQAQAAAGRVAELRDVVEDAGKAAQAADLDDSFIVAGRAISGLAGAFQTVTSLQAVFGTESKKTEEALKKVQATLALTQGITAIFEGVKAFRALAASIASSNVLLKIYQAGTIAAGAVTRLFGGAVNSTSVAFKGLAVAIAATGIGLLVTALGVAIPLLIKLFTSTKAADDALQSLTGSEKGLGDEVERTNRLIDDRNKALDFQTKKAVLLARIAGKSQADINAIEAAGRQEGLKKAKEDSEKATKLFLDTQKKTGDALAAILLSGSEEEKNKAQETRNKILADLKDDALKKKGVVTQLENEIVLTALQIQADGSDKQREQATNKQKELIEKLKQAKTAAGKILTDLDRRNASESEQAIFKIQDEYAEKRKTLAKAGIKDFTEINKAEAEEILAVQTASNNAVLLARHNYEKALFNVILNAVKKRKELDEQADAARLQSRELAQRADLSGIKDSGQRRLQELRNVENKEMEELEKSYENKKISLEKFLQDQAAIERFYANERAGVQTDSQKKTEEELKAFQEKYTGLVESGLEDALEALGTAIGEGEDPFAALSKSIGNSLANFVTSLGKDMVKLGTLFKILSEALNKLKPPGLKVAVGLALIAFGAAIRSSINKKSENKFARGGFVDGPGTETSDSIPARLSKGEYVIKAKSVRKYGARTIEKINKGQVPVASLARATSQENNEFFENIISRGRSGGTTKALVNRFEAPLLFSNGGYVDDFYENIISRGRSGGTTKALVNRSSNELGEALKQFTRNGGTSKALVNRFEVPEFFSQGGLVDDRQYTRNGGTSKALVNRFEVPQFFSDGGLVEATRQFGRKGGTTKALVNRFEMPTLPNVNMTETFQREVPYIATTKVSGQDLKIILERADRRYSNAT